MHWTLFSFAVPLTYRLRWGGGGREVGGAPLTVRLPEPAQARESSDKGPGGGAIGLDFWRRCAPPSTRGTGSRPWPRCSNAPAAPERPVGPACNPPEPGAGALRGRSGRRRVAPGPRCAVRLERPLRQFPPRWGPASAVRQAGAEEPAWVRGHGCQWPAVLPESTSASRGGMRESFAGSLTGQLAEVPTRRAAPVCG